MRPKVETGRKHKARGVSLSPEQEQFALGKCHKVNMSFSKYMQALIRLDQKRNLVREMEVA